MASPSFEAFSDRPRSARSEARPQAGHQRAISRGEGSGKRGECCRIHHPYIHHGTCALHPSTPACTASFHHVGRVLHPPRTTQGSSCERTKQAHQGRECGASVRRVCGGRADGMRRGGDHRESHRARVHACECMRMHANAWLPSVPTLGASGGGTNETPHPTSSPIRATCSCGALAACGAID